LLPKDRVDITAEIRAALGDEWLPIIYAKKIRTQRTRKVSISVPPRENIVEVQYTLLGVELKIGRHRFTCPDLATARFMRVFGRIGIREFAVPYDITGISAAADELETAWQRVWLLLDEKTLGRSSRGIAQLRSRLIRAIRLEVDEIGAGDAIPAFDRKTRQRGA